MYIQCQALGKSYGEGSLRVSVLSDLHLDIEVGERVAIIGSSGSGKSTLLHLIGGLDLPDTGNVVVADKIVNRLNETQRCLWRADEVGFIYQFHHLLPEFTVLENVALPLLIRRQKNQTSYTEAAALLESVGLGNRLEHKSHELSGGERQRVAICRALINKPGVILADEPTGNLDAQTGNLVMDLVLEMSAKHNLALIVATHNQALCERFDRVYRLDGRCLQGVTPN